MVASKGFRILPFDHAHVLSETVKQILYLEKFESDLSKINEDIAPQSHEILQRFV